MGEDRIPRGSMPAVVAEPDLPTYARSEGAPRIGPAGLAVTVRVLASRPGAPERGPQVALACAQHAAGWSVGLDASGRVSLVVGTSHGPASALASGPLVADEWYDVFARIPGGPGRLEVGVRRSGSNWVTGGVLIGSSIFAAEGPLLWGCRSLFDDRVAEMPFDGVVAAPTLMADAGARGVGARPPRGGVDMMAWDAEVSVGFRS